MRKPVGRGIVVVGAALAVLGVATAVQLRSAAWEKGIVIFVGVALGLVTWGRRLAGGDESG